MMQVFYTGLQGCAKNIWLYAEDGTRIGWLSRPGDRGGVTVNP